MVGYHWKVRNPTVNTVRSLSMTSTTTSSMRCSRIPLFRNTSEGTERTESAEHGNADPVGRDTFAHVREEGRYAGVGHQRSGAVRPPMAGPLHRPADILGYTFLHGKDLAWMVQFVMARRVLGGGGGRAPLERGGGAAVA